MCQMFPIISLSKYFLPYFSLLFALIGTCNQFILIILNARIKYLIKMDIRSSVTEIRSATACQVQSTLLVVLIQQKYVSIMTKKLLLLSLFIFYLHSLRTPGLPW